MGASGLWGVRTSRGVWVACSGGVDAGAAVAMAVEAVSGASEAEAEAAAMVAAVRAMAAVAAAMAAARVAIVAVAVAAMAAAAVVVVVATAAAVMGEMAMAGMALMAEQAQHSQKAQAHSPLRIHNLSWSRPRVLRVSESCERARATRRPRRCAGLTRGAKKMRNKCTKQKTFPKET
jgi:hypothetical protein